MQCFQNYQLWPIQYVIDTFVEAKINDSFGISISIHMNAFTSPETEASSTHSHVWAAALPPQKTLKISGYEFRLWGKVKVLKERSPAVHILTPVRKQSNPPGSAVSSPWDFYPLFKGWLQPVAGDETKAFCHCCIFLLVPDITVQKKQCQGK